MMALPEAKIEATDARLAALSLPEGGWSEPGRRAALARVQTLGLPSRRDEYWKYTRPDDLLSVEAPKAATFESGEAPIFDPIERLRIVFVDGMFDADASDPLELEGVQIERLATARSDIHWAKDIYGVLEARGQNPVPRAFAALNTAFAQDGVLLHVTGKPTKPIHLIYHHTSDASDAILHHVIKVDAGAEATILESGPAAARFNKCMEVDLADTASLHHIRAQGRDHERRAVTHTFARLGSEASFKSFTLTVNGQLTRNECVIEILGDDAVAHVAGACVGDGEFHHDDTVFITHDAVNCERRQVLT
jgi:Fe-S cluster assembly protein SufD